MGDLVHIRSSGSQHCGLIGSEYGDYIVPNCLWSIDLALVE